MSKKVSKTGSQMRIIHRYLGFFLAGIMAMYSLSGITLIFRNTDFLKKEVVIEKTIKANLEGEQLGKELKIKNLKVTSNEGSMIHFKEGTCKLLRALEGIEFLYKELDLVWVFTH